MKTHPLTPYYSQTGALLSVIAAVIAVLLVCVLSFNDGTLIYTLDDPYIHLRLAENIARGHYGLNPGEFASPSSSVIWPFLLAPFAATSAGHFVPLIINIAACILTACVVQQTLSHVYPRFAALMTFLLLMTTNIIGVVFTGMEHSLQILLAVYITGGMIALTEDRPLPGLLGAALVLAPLVRYELLALSLGAIGLLLLYRRFHYALAAVVIMLALGAFSFFLLQHGGHAMPSSVLVKIWGSQGYSFLNAIPPVIALWLLLAYGAVLHRQRRRLLMCLYMSACVAAHLALGKTGWFSRYEVYIVLSAYMVLIYYAVSAGIMGQLRQPFSVALGIAVYVLTNSVYLVTLLSVPGASHSIYLQQVQMRRFADTAAVPSVAVNDIGYISYRSSAYVYDLYGLGNVDIYEQFHEGDTRLLEVVSSRDVPLVMLYPAWLKKIAAPDKWVKLGELSFDAFPGLIIATPAMREIEFYAASRIHAQALQPALEQWQKGLPEHAVWSGAQ